MGCVPVREWDTPWEPMPNPNSERYWRPRTWTNGRRSDLSETDTRTWPFDAADAFGEADVVGDAWLIEQGAVRPRPLFTRADLHDAGR